MTTKSCVAVTRAAYTIEQFSAIFGHARAWGYRMVRLKRVRAIRGFGSMLIPASEVDRILADGDSEGGSQ